MKTRIISKKLYETLLDQIHDCENMTAQDMVRWLTEVIVGECSENWIKQLNNRKAIVTISNACYGTPSTVMVEIEGSPTKASVIVKLESYFSQDNIKPDSIRGIAFYMGGSWWVHDTVKNDSDWGRVILCRDIIAKYLSNAEVLKQ